MKKIRTMEEFAAAVGLSRPTVSKFFDNPASVRTTTRQKIEAALKATGFKPNIFAVNLNRRRSKIIGVVIPDPMDPFFMALSRRIEVSATERGFWAVVLSTNGEAQLEARALETIQSLNAGGAVIASVNSGSLRDRMKSLGRHIPLVFADSPLDSAEPFVGTDNRQSIPLMVDYLCRTGDAPVYFDTPATNHNTTERRLAYVAAMKKLGHKPQIINPITIANLNVEELSHQMAAQMMRDGSLPGSTILCASDRVAFGVMAALNEAGARIGGRPGCTHRVAGHDNHLMSAFMWPPLTTVAQDVKRLGQIALDLLLSRMDQGEPPRGGERILLGGELVIRRSA